MRHGPVGNDLLNLDGNGLGLKHADDDGQSAVPVHFAQHECEGPRLGLAGGKPEYF